MTVDDASTQAADEATALASALAASGTGTWRWDAASGVVIWDVTLERLAGMGPGEFRATFEAWKDTLHPDEVDDILAKVDDAILRRGGYHFEHRTIWPDGSVRWLECRGEVTTDADGNITGTVGCAVDVTERIEQLERERRHAARFRFLSRLTDRALSVGEHPEFMRYAATAAVPELGDWCSIHFVPESGGPIEVVVAHADPQKVEWADRLALRFPYDPSGHSGVGAVIRSGRTEFIPVVTQELIDQNLAEASFDTSELRQVVDALKLTSVITVPLTTERGVLGAVQFVSAESGRSYDRDDVALAEMAARRIADALDNLWLTEQHRKISATLQRALLPPVMPDIPGVDLAVRYWPAGAAVEAGGDFYDVFPSGSDRWSLLIGDVCGTGSDAAALTGITRHTTRAAARHGQDHIAVLEWLNQAMLLSNRDRFCTAVYATLTRQAHRWVLTSCAAGHPRPILIRAGEARTLGATGTLLGVFTEMKLEPADTVLSEGDTVVFYTDGLTDLPPPNDRTEDDLAALLAELGPSAASAGDLADQIRARLVDPVAVSSRDDAAVVVVVVGG